MPTLLTRTSRGRTAALAAAVLTGLAMAAPASAAPADSRDIPTEGLLASYDFSAESGAVLADRSGNDRDGAVVGTPSWHGGYMHFDGQNYVELPDGMLAEEQAATVIIETAPQHLGGAQFLWNFGGSGDEATGQFFIQPVDPRVSISASNYTAEQTAQAEQDLQEGTWQSIAATIAPNPGGQTSTLRLYVDGELWAEKTDSTTNLDDLTTHTMNYIGQSAYRPDSLYQGKVSAFHVYNRALPPEQLAAVAETDAPAAAAETAAALDLQAVNQQDLSRIEFDITLPTAGGITWSSEPAGIIAPDGTVTQPPETT
ncbi:MAG TPA: LamG-like jellyroll fold domain-containing protein, partial [Deinococcales bacterium]|nr:LamG-like jellyroll fold domain-containing protein [Deinococcales bacterium]